MLFDELDGDDDFDEDVAEKDLFASPSEKSFREHHDENITLSARQTATLIGHHAIEQQLLTMLEHNRFPHGLIFSGMEGVGKSVMAFRLARYLFAKKSGVCDDRSLSLFGDSPEKERDKNLYLSPSDPDFVRVAGGGNPDLLVIERPIDDKTGLLKSSVPVEEIRKIAPFMRKTASVAGGWRVVIVDDADTMTRSSQNSLLKILEEPPEKSLLILIAHRAGAILPTIYSRCVHIPFFPLKDEDILPLLQARCFLDNTSLILAMAEGSLGAALAYAENESVGIISQTLELLNSGERLRWQAIQHFADLLGTKGSESAQRIFKDTLFWVASGLVRNKLEGFDVYRKLPLVRRLAIYDRLKRHFDLCLNGNLDKRFLILGAFMAFESE